MFIFVGRNVLRIGLVFKTFFGGIMKFGKSMYIVTIVIVIFAIAIILGIGILIGKI